jgi:hypothetical protein
MPLMTIVFGEMIDVFTNYQSKQITREQFDKDIIMNVVYFWYDRLLGHA